MFCHAPLRAPVPDGLSRSVPNLLRLPPRPCSLPYESGAPPGSRALAANRSGRAACPAFRRCLVQRGDAPHQECNADQPVFVVQRRIAEPADDHGRPHRGGKKRQLRRRRAAGLRAQGAGGQSGEARAAQREEQGDKDNPRQPALPPAYASRYCARGSGGRIGAFPGRNPAPPLQAPPWFPPRMRLARTGRIRPRTTGGSGVFRARPGGFRRGRLSSRRHGASRRFPASGGSSAGPRRGLPRRPAQRPRDRRTSAGRSRNAS